MRNLGQGKRGITHLHACKRVRAHCVQGCVWGCWRHPGVFASPWLQGARALVLSDCAKGGHGIPDTGNSASLQNPEQGWLRCLEEIQEGFPEKVTSELDLER